MSGIYNEGILLSQGAYGKVYLASNESNTVALKKIPLDRNILTDEVINECFVLRSLSCTDNQNIVKLVDTPYVHGGELCLPFELADYNLAKYLHNISADETKLFLCDIIHGCYGFHPLIIHRDLKPENILVFDNNTRKTVKIADFGLARALLSLGIELSPLRGTRGYQAPEVLLGSLLYGAPADMWSVGCIFYEMLTQERFISGGRTNSDLHDIQSKVGQITKFNMPELDCMTNRSMVQYRVRFEGLGDTFEGHDPDAVDLLRKLLTIDPRQRITAAEALQHPYFWGLN